MHDINDIHPIKIKFLKTGIVTKDLDPKLQVTIVRIIQEQLNNILRHANADTATITLSRVGDDAILLISDNGDGCDMLTGKNGVGIINIKSRADLYNGYTTIVSNPGEGYELKVVLPLMGLESIV